MGLAEVAPILDVRDIRVRYGAIEAVKGVSLTVGQGEIVTLIGGNGAGKTTTLKTISCVLHPASGEVWFEGERVDRLPSHEVVRRGICQAPEGRRIFPRMTVNDNLEMGAYARRDHEAVGEDFERVFALFPVLKERLRQPGGTLSGGEQQMLAIARALMARPKLLLLDEPSMGLAPMMVDRIFDVVREINAQGTPILLVEQNAQMALQTAGRGYVLESGTVVLEDEAETLLGNDRVRKAYLGGE
ncbi:MAG TPA: ABC transporter ATP-binding protein [Actinomycetota bacterium]|nr:ABC transporter ATP-binding protein [Actinomycetota bacterium]